jgi:hypothetical protein
LRWLQGTLVKSTALSCRSIGPHGVCQMTTFFAFLKDDSGATAIEYGLLAAGRVILHRVSLRVAASVFSGFF